MKYKIKCYNSKTFTEKMGDFLSSMGKRFLFGMGVFLVGLLLLFVPTLILLPPFDVIGLVGLPLFLGGMFVAISVLEDASCIYEGTYILKTTDGRIIPYAIVKIEEKAYMPVIPFFCPFFYVPYRTTYILVKDSGNHKDLRKGMRISGAFIGYCLFGETTLTKSQYKALLENSPEILQELNEQNKARKMEFDQDIKRFIDAGLIELIYDSEGMTICNLTNVCYGVFCYTENSNGEQCGFLTNAKFALKVAKNHSMLFQDVIGKDSETLGKQMIALGDKAFSFLKEQKIKTDQEGPGIDIDKNIEEEIRKINFA